MGLGSVLFRFTAVILKTPPPHLGDKIPPLLNLNSEKFGMFVLAVPPLLFSETTSLDAAPALFS